MSKTTEVYTESEMLVTIAQPVEHAPSLVRNLGICTPSDFHYKVLSAANRKVDKCGSNGPMLDEHSTWIVTIPINDQPCEFTFELPQYEDLVASVCRTFIRLIDELDPADVSSVRTRLIAYVSELIHAIELAYAPRHPMIDRSRAAATQAGFASND